MGYASKLKQQYAHYATLDFNEVSKVRDKRNQAGIFYKPVSSGRNLTCRQSSKTDIKINSYFRAKNG